VRPAGAAAVRARALVGGAEGPGPARTHRRPRHRAVLRVRERPARPALPHLARGRHVARRRLRRAAAAGARHHGRPAAGGLGGGPPDAELLALAARVPAGSDGLVMLPYLLPERAPMWEPELSGAFLGIRHSHTRGHFVRAAVEGVAQQLAGILRRVDAVSPVA